MPVAVDEVEAAARSRLTAIRLTMLTLRLMENWRRNVSDYDSAMVLAAVVAITAERLTRSEIDPELGPLERELPRELLARCNISSIAAATGLNRETARRKVNELIAEGFLVRSPEGVVGFAPGRLQREETLALVRTQLDAVVRLLNELLRDGVLKMV